MDIQTGRPAASSDVGAIPAPAPGQVIGQVPPQQTAQQPKVKKSRKGLIIALVTGLVILVIGAGVAGFIIYTNNNKPAPAATETPSESERVNVEEIDATTAEIDKTLNTLNDSTDVTPNDVTDSALGL
jgi:cytoskeletal protein RodZ